jgi:glucosamine-6-phosphate deaminase
LPFHARPDPKNFGEGETIPEYGITTGIATLSAAKHVILLADGEKKRAAVQELLSGKQSMQWPVTALQNHPGLKLFITEDLL